MRRLRSHLLFWLLVPLLLLWALAFRLQVVRSGQQSDEAHDRVLLGSAMVIRDRLAVVDGRVAFDVPHAALEMIVAHASDRVFHNVSCTSPPAFIGGEPALDAIGLPADAAPALSDGKVDGMPVRVAALRHLIAGAPDCGEVVVRVAETTLARDALSGQILRDLVVHQGLLIAAAASLIFFGVGRGLRPLRRIRDEMHSRHPHDLSPLDLQKVPSEVAPLVEAVNLHLQRQRSINEAHRRFVADASHQLKTPLAVLQTQAELALRQRDGAAMRAYVEELHASTQTTARVVHQLLALLRSDPTALHGSESIDLVEGARQATFDLLPLALAKEIDLGFEGQGPVLLSWHGVLLHELVANLVDNAIRYTPRQGRIRVTVRAGDDGSAELEVADSGPGIPADQREKVFQRFYRLPGSSDDGCGLGLAIVRQIAERYGASVALGTAPEGGLLATVRMRSATPPR